MTEDYKNNKSRYGEKHFKVKYVWNDFKLKMKMVLQSINTRFKITRAMDWCRYQIIPLINNRSRRRDGVGRCI